MNEELKHIIDAANARNGRNIMMVRVLGVIC